MSKELTRALASETRRVVHTSDGKVEVHATTLPKKKEVMSQSERIKCERAIKEMKAAQQNLADALDNVMVLTLRTAYAMLLMGDKVAVEAFNTPIQRKCLLIAVKQQRDGDVENINATVMERARHVVASIKLHANKE